MAGIKRKKKRKRHIKWSKLFWYCPDQVHVVNDLSVGAIMLYCLEIIKIK